MSTIEPMSKDTPAQRGGSGTGSLADQLFRQVKSQIVCGTLSSGMLLTEQELAREFSVSRAPAREALQRLSRAGLVNARARVGYLVSGVTLRDYEEVFELRLLLEPRATELATQRVAAGLETIDRLHELAELPAKLQAADPDNCAEAIRDANRAFHELIATMSGNRRLAAWLESLMDDISRVMHLLGHDRRKLMTLLHDHPDLVAVMRSGNHRGAGALMAEQLTNTREVMRGLAVGSPIEIV